MPGRAIGGIVAALLLVACSTPEPNRGAQDDVGRPVPTHPTPPDGGSGTRRDATLTGRIVGPDGSPLAGAAVTVVESRSGLGLDAALAAVFTLGIACVASTTACDAGDRVVDSATTDADGRYELTLPGAHLPGYETDEDWVLSVGRAPAAGERSGPSSSYELEVNTAVHEAPDLALWDGTPAVAVDGPLLRITTPRLEAGPELQNPAPRFVDAGGGVLWGVEGETVDVRVLEDRSAVFVSSGFADVTVRHGDGRTIYHQHVATATVPYTGTAVPVSRGQACVLAGGAAVGCPLTDGDLFTPSPVPSGEATTVDLGTPAELGAIVVRGTGSHLSDDLVVEVSRDAATWTVLPHRRLTGANGWSAGPTPGSGLPTVRFLRITGAEELIEVSAWPPTDLERAAARPDAAVPGDRAGDDAAASWLVVLAGALALGAGGLLLHHRRRGRI